MQRTRRRSLLVRGRLEQQPLSKRYRGTPQRPGPRLAQRQVGTPGDAARQQLRQRHCHYGKDWGAKARGRLLLVIHQSLQQKDCLLEMIGRMCGREN